MNHDQQLARIPIQQPVHNPPQVIQVGDRLYQISEITSQPQPQPIQPQPHPIHAYPLPPQSAGWDVTKNLILLGVVGGCGAGLVAVVFVRALAPAPVAAPTQPQTIIMQPPQPEKKPYSFRECQPGGMFGWGQNCREERGWQ